MGFRCSSHNVGKLCSWSDLAFCVLPLLWSAWLFGLVSVLACPGTSTSVSWHVHSHVQRAHVPLLTEPATFGLAPRSAYKLQIHCNYLHFKSDISYGPVGANLAMDCMDCSQLAKPCQIALVSLGPQYHYVMKMYSTCTVCTIGLGHPGCGMHAQEHAVSTALVAGCNGVAANICPDWLQLTTPFSGRLLSKSAIAKKISMKHR